MDTNYSICVVHGYSVPAKLIFTLIQNGTLFELTGADEISFDFSQGGSFKLIFTRRGLIEGKFIQIDPYQQIILDWIVTGFGRKKEVNTKVVISILSKDDMTILEVEHSGIPTETSKKAKERAWSEILKELANKL